ncbi:unnamed protein product [Lymnaea stagnalis]|uniref:Uncharacterized protein n=1 Tax=Lymnaea stagnalis TaxID=6523 RepID=A0AAV2I3Q4_LYMST
MGLETTLKPWSVSTAAYDGALRFECEKMHPRMITRELRIGLIMVELLIPNLQPGADKSWPNDGRVQFTWIGQCGFDVRVSLKVGNIYQLWIRKVKKLPSDIILHSSSWDCLSGRIEIMLHTNVTYSWLPMLHVKGLDQASSDENDD